MSDNELRDTFDSGYDMGFGDGARGVPTTLEDAREAAWRLHNDENMNSQAGVAGRLPNTTNQADREAEAASQVRASQPPLSVADRERALELIREATRLSVRQALAMFEPEQIQADMIRIQAKFKEAEARRLLGLPEEPS